MGNFCLEKYSDMFYIPFWNTIKTIYHCAYINTSKKIIENKQLDKEMLTSTSSFSGNKKRYLKQKVT